MSSFPNGEEYREILNVHCKFSPKLILLIYWKYIDAGSKINKVIKFGVMKK